MSKNIYNNSKLVKELLSSDFVLNSNGKSYLNNKDYKGKPMLIKFYAPWCPHCTKLKPTLKSLGKKFKDKGLIVGAVNCDNQNIKNKVNIEGFPTIFLVKRGSGRLVEYTNPNDLNSISDTINKLYF
jgi:thiol-disulfide isomerase/thioredoxin